MRRRVLLLLMLSAAAAAAIAYHVAVRSRRVLARDAWTTFGEPAVTPAPPPRAASAPSETPPAEEAPAEAPAMVVATMEATPAAREPAFETNGPAAEPEPAKAASEAVAAPAGAGRIEWEGVQRPRRRGPSGATLAALGALTGAAAIALGAWGIASSVSDDDGATQSPPALQNVEQVVSLIAQPTTTTIPLKGSGRRIILVVGARGYGVLVLNNVNPAPSGRTYQAWVIRPDVKAPQPAGLFPGGTGVVKLTKPVPPGGVVAITVEPAGGSAAPTQQPKLVATRT